MREFTTAVEEKGALTEPPDDDLKPITFKHDGREVSFGHPNASQFTLLAAMSAGMSDTDSAGVLVNLFFALADHETARYFRQRMIDPQDKFGLDGPGGMAEILGYLIQEWSGRPTQQPSDSPPSRSSRGGRSTARTRVAASTSSTSPPADSSPSS